ncbi:MAG: M20 family metallopeptidase [Proteobacteria bacterium]|nr:M20 family metallopeptidase [Pseudomonadota bacterium]
MPDALQLTRELLKFNTINPPGAEQACAQHLGDLLKRAGFTVDYAEFAPTRTSLVAKIGGVKGKRPLGFTGHIDTVPLGSAAWKADAFGASLEGGKLYGRGSSDMKSGVAAFVVAALRMVEQLKNGPGVTLVITADEECGCGGATYMVKQGNLLGEVGALVIGEPTANYPLVGHKGAFWPEQGDNAIYKAAAAITKLRDFDFETPAHALMGAPTLNVGTVHGGLNINSVPDLTVIGVDIRSVPGQNHALLQSRMQRMLGETVEVTATLDVASIYSDPAQPWIQHVFDVTQSRLGARPQAKTATYFTDAAVLKEAYRDIPMVVLGPGEPQLAHQTDEYCLVDRIEESVAIYSELIKDWSH